MRDPLRLTVGMLAVALAAACSQPDKPAVPDDLKADLARVGGGDVQLAGSPSPRLDVVSAVERNERNAPAPKAPSVTRIASTSRGTRAVVHSARHVTPAPAQADPAATETAPAEAPMAQAAPEPVRSQVRPQAAPAPSTQREPVGGWKSEGEVFRRAPFPINP